MKNLMQFALLGALALALTSSTSLASSWDDAIAEKKRRSQAYYERARALGLLNLGTAYNEVYVPKALAESVSLHLPSSA